VGVMVEGIVGGFLKQIAYGQLFRGKKINLKAQRPFSYDK